MLSSCSRPLLAALLLLGLAARLAAGVKELSGWETGM